MGKDQKSRFSLDDQDSGADHDQNDHEQQESAQSNRDSSRSDTDEDYASSERYDTDRVKLVDFLQYPREKRKLTEFVEDTYKAYEQEAIDRLLQRVIHEHDTELRGSTPWHKPGHIGPLMHEYLSMVGVESSFVSGLQHTKSSMTKSVQQRVDEINTLLRGVGGFNRQIKASFSRSAVVYLEHEDPHNRNRERVTFTVNIGDYELRYPLDETANDQTVEDGRTLRRMVWDEAVNTLAEIVSNTGLKPKYVKNDKNNCVFTMRQYLLSSEEKTPDEFFTFDLRHVNAQMKKQMSATYAETVSKIEAQIAAYKKKLGGWFLSRKTKEAIADRIAMLEKEKDFFVGTNADPREMDTGLVFSISVNTLKDYSVTKDKMQVIMTKYILALSKIAVDKSMDQQVNTVYQRGQNKPRDFQNMDEDVSSGREEKSGKGKRVVVMKDDLIRKKAG
jgi:hypothetical protein